MADDGRSTDQTLAQLADDVLPALVARLSESELGEIEVRRGSWRVRLRREGRNARDVRQVNEGSSADSRRHRTSSTASASEAPASAVDASRAMVTSPAVGYYQPIESLEVGRSVRQGDVVGHVDVLGMRQDVVTGGDGVVGRLLVQPGQAVEYGQEILRIDRLAAVPRAGGAGGAAGAESDGASA